MKKIDGNSPHKRKRLLENDSLPPAKKVKKELFHHIFNSTSALDQIHSYFSVKDKSKFCSLSREIKTLADDHKEIREEQEFVKLISGSFRNLKDIPLEEKKNKKSLDKFIARNVESKYDLSKKEMEDIFFSNEPQDILISECIELKNRAVWSIKHLPLNIIKKLVDKKFINVNGIVNDPFKTPFIHLACVRGDMEIIKYLISQGANISAENWYHKNALFTLISRADDIFPDRDSKNNEKNLVHLVHFLLENVINVLGDNFFDDGDDRFFSFSEALPEFIYKILVGHLVEREDLHNNNLLYALRLSQNKYNDFIESEKHICEKMIRKGILNERNIEERISIPYLIHLGRTGLINYFFDKNLINKNTFASVYNENLQEMMHNTNIDGFKLAFSVGYPFSKSDIKELLVRSAFDNDFFIFIHELVINKSIHDVKLDEEFDIYHVIFTEILRQLLKNSSLKNKKEIDIRKNPQKELLFNKNYIHILASILNQQKDAPFSLKYYLESVNLYDYGGPSASFLGTARELAHYIKNIDLINLFTYYAHHMNNN